MVLRPHLQGLLPISSHNSLLRPASRDSSLGFTMPPGKPRKPSKRICIRTMCLMGIFPNSLASVSAYIITWHACLYPLSDNDSSLEISCPAIVNSLLGFLKLFICVMIF
uniref:Uncharacterized protein n=1 Tax=Anguilla anguilla TaxID=7936 RepID=A0A0E9UC59_ANGAN